MNITDAKKVLVKHLNNLIGQWFNDKPLYEGIALTIVQANINKFDGLLTMLTDENGNIMIDALTDNLKDLLERGYEIDLTAISGLLPHRVLIISKDDIKAVIDEIKRG